MGFFGNQFANVVEWEEFNDQTLFWKWSNKEIKKGSRLILKPGQDAIFIHSGKIEGIFTDDGDYDIESQIVPFLSTLKGFKFGFNSGMRAEVLFVNTKEINVKWGTKKPINVPAQGLPGGMPIRSFGSFDVKVDDYPVFIEKIAGVKSQFDVGDVKDRVIAMIDQLLMKWISREGKDMFNLQANSFEIGKGIREDLDMEMSKIGIAVPNFNISSFSYPEEIAAMQRKAAGQSMLGDVDKYTRIAMADSMEKGTGAGNMAGNMAGMQMGMMMGQQMMNQMQQGGAAPQNSGGAAPQGGGGGAKFCPECGTQAAGGKFCTNCGAKLG